MRYRGLIFGFFAVVIVIILLVLLWPSGSKKPQTPTEPALQPLPDYADTTAEVSLTTDGIVNGDDIHRAIRITVNNSSRTLDIIQGYSGTVIDTHGFNNTTDAYSVFLKAINSFGFLSKVSKPKVPADPAGQCPLGFRYIYKLTQDGSDLSSTWRSSCSTGTSGGNASSLLDLFQNQITNYSKLTQDVNLSATSSQPD